MSETLLAKVITVLIGPDDMMSFSWLLTLEGPMGYPAIAGLWQPSVHSDVAF